MFFTDIHIHALYGVDDGAKTEAEMQAIVDASYADGIRTLCVTPHFHPGYFGDNENHAETAYQRLEAYIQQKYPDMELYRGNELRYSRNCVSWLNSRSCHTLNGTQYVLVDFSEAVEAQKISSALEHLLSAGYRPVLAHVERYRTFWGHKSLIHSFWEKGVLLQVDAQSVLGGFGYLTQRQSRYLLENELADLICSDSHDVRQRPPELSRCFQLVRKKYGLDYANALFCDNGKRLLHEDALQEELD